MVMLRSLLFLTFLGLGTAAYGAGLQVTPIVLDIKQTQKSDGLWLTNTSNNPMDVQVRVFEWVQQNQADVLNATTEFVASPPLVKISSGQKQFIRLVRVGQKPASAERAYRIVVDELPLERTGSKGLNFALRYSIPVFIQAGTMPSPPSLTWQVSSGSGGEVFLTIANSGSARAKLSGLKFVSKKGQSTVINQGLFGYVLANSSRRWSVPKISRMLASGGHFEVMMNDGLVSVPVSTLR